MISVLLPYRNAAATLAEALESVLADLTTNDEVVAIDDGSSDGSADLVRAVAARDQRVVQVRSASTGLVGALATGVATAHGELLARMDADDVSLPGRFGAQRALLESDPRLGAVGVQVEAFPSPGAGMQRYLAWQNSLTTPEEHARALFIESPLCHPSTMLRRAALESVGGFREVAWAEDYDLWLRMDAAGLALAKVPRVLFRWRLRGESMTWTDPKCAPARFLEARALFLAKRLRTLGPFAVWGAGQTGRRLARALEVHGLVAEAFADIDPKKIGRRARGREIVAAETAIERARRGEWLVVVAVGRAGARELVRDRLAAAGVLEGVGFWCAA
jgi:glycosyltransferase involved in cell wall biosynthesis